VAGCRGGGGGARGYWTAVVGDVRAVAGGGAGTDSVCYRRSVVAE